ncbi:DUF2163 domain-containing protein [Brevundimonas sp.]|uniref:DUF2163 domain-containing protein n=1 Tax=Brevundimonas sp. TaxID=1871086 RepID=UPI0028ABB854|nr:DUF2163 domain-containing protein [Brevundimonas sp.]
MRDLSEEMAARIESGAAMLCHAWVLRRTDGETLGFTDHDRDLELEGVVCRAGSGWTAGAGEGAVGLAAGGLSASGGLDDAAITEDDISTGLYDQARVELWRVDWMKPALRVRLWAGTLARIRRANGAFVADLDGPMAALERVVGRTYGRTCDAVLGDARCGLSVEAIAGRRCDKRWSSCTGRFGNGVNFQGFPDIPGDDFIAARPADGGRHDGGSRR